MRQIIAVWALVAFVVGFPAAGFGSSCEGETPLSFEKGHYRFETNSDMTIQDGLARYSACVANLSSNVWLRVNWFIPKVQNLWVPPNEAIIHPRYSVDADARPLDSCLQYGNLGKRVVTQVLGDATDAARSRVGGEWKCQLDTSSSPEEGDVVTQLQPIHENLKVYVPSDLDAPEASMLVVNFTYGMKPSTEGYVIYSELEAEPLEHALDANPADITLHVRIPSQYFAAQMPAALDGGMKLSKASGFEYLVSGQSSWRLIHATYEFVDNAGRVASRFQLPHFEPI